MWGQPCFLPQTRGPLAQISCKNPLTPVTRCVYVPQVTALVPCHLPHILCESTAGNAGDAMAMTGIFAHVCVCVCVGHVGTRFHMHVMECEDNHAGLTHAVHRCTC